MKTIKVIKEDIAILLRELGDMRSLCISENRDPCEEEQTSSVEKLDKIAALEKLLALEVRTQATLDRTKEPTEPPDKTVVDTKIDKIEQEKRDNFASNGEFYAAVIRAGAPGGSVDPRLSTRAASGLQEGIPSDGGFLVGTEMAAGLLKNVWSTGQILPLIDKVTLSGNTNAMTFNGLDETSRATGSRSGGIIMSWAGEAEEKTASKPKFRQIELKLKKIVGLAYMTDELLDDSEALSQEIDNGFRAELEFMIINSAINGTGVNQPLGILTSGAMVSITKETGQPANTVVYENVSNMWSRLLASSRPNSIFIINQNVEPQLHKMSLAIGTGGSAVFMPMGGASVQPYSTLFGRPVIPLEQCPVLGDTGDIMLCDFSKYKAIDKGGARTDLSIHVRFVYDESCFRITYRYDGEPVLASPITPFTAGATTATDTLSHFVKLNARD